LLVVPVTLKIEEMMLFSSVSANVPSAAVTSAMLAAGVWNAAGTLPEPAAF
jgi:hypothetical protein